MQGKLVSSILLFSLLLSAIVLAHNVQPVKSDYAWTQTIYIRADGSIDPSNAPISSVDNVTYTLTDNILENGIDSTTAIVIQRDNIILDGAGYTLNGTQPAGNSIGIDLSGISNVTIENMKITAFDHGIHLESSSDNSVSGNNITANTYVGIELEYSSNNNSVSGNNITANNGEGIYLYSSSNNNMNGNNIANNDYGIYLYSSSNNNSVSGNNITANKEYGIYLQSYAYEEKSVSGNNITANNITANNGYGIFLDVSTNNNRIAGNNITANTDEGIYLYSSSDNSVSGNSFVDDGLFVDDSYGNVMTDNLVNGKPLVYLETVSGYAVGNAGQVVLVECSNVTVENLNLSNTNIAVELWETKTSRISGNNIANNGVGIELYSSSNNNVNGNNIANNGYGILLYSSNNNTFYHNDLINNTSQVYSLSSTNVWSNGEAPALPIYLYILTALAIIIAVGAIAFIMRRKKKPPEDAKGPQI